MKNLCYIIFVIIMLVACNGKQTGVKFSPEKKVSKLTEQEREKAILKKRKELSDLNIDTLLLSNNIKLTILSPKPQGEITQDVSKFAETKMLQIACQNGISGLGTNPVFILAMTLTPINKEVTRTIPEKKTGTYNMNMYIGNTITKEIYASYSSQIIGVGDTFEQVAINAISSIKNTQEIQQILKNASKKIIQWYDINIESFKMQIDKLLALGEYAHAYTLLSSVPETSKKCFEYSVSKIDFVLKSLMEQNKANNLAKMKNAIAEAGTSYDTKVAAYYQMIPINSPEREIAEKLYTKYISDIEKYVNNELEHKRYLEKTELELRVLEVQAKIEASHEAMLQYQSTQNTCSYVQETDQITNEGNIMFDQIFSNVINLAKSQVPTILNLLI